MRRHFDRLTALIVGGGLRKKSLTAYSQKLPLVLKLRKKHSFESGEAIDASPNDLEISQIFLKFWIFKAKWLFIQQIMLKNVENVENLHKMTCPGSFIALVQK